MPVIRAEIVRDHAGMTVGLMGRRHLPRNAGMLFDFGSDQPLSFWMKNTYIPLQIAFIDSKCVVRKISSMAPLSMRSIRSEGDCRYALEVNEGWFDEHEVKVGATIAVPGSGGGQPTEPGQGGPGQGGPGQGQKDQGPKTPPDVVVEQSIKDILKAVSDNGVVVVVEYVTKEGSPIPPKMVSPPFVFGETAEGDPNGLVTVWDEQVGRYTSLIVDNITGIKDRQGNPIPNAEAVARLSGAMQNRQVDDMSAKGKLA